MLFAIYSFMIYVMYNIPGRISIPKGAIIGGVLGRVTIMLIVLVVVYLLWHVSTKSSDHQQGTYLCTPLLQMYGMKFWESFILNLYINLTCF